VSLDTGSGVQQIIAPDDLGVGIGKKGVCVAAALAQSPGYLRSVDADRNRANSEGLQPIQFVFDTPQLGVAERSPITAIKNEQHTPGGLLRARGWSGEQLRKRHLLSVGIQQ
jgi:hypothetical protein